MFEKKRLDWPSGSRPDDDFGCRQTSLRLSTRFVFNSSKGGWSRKGAHLLRRVSKADNENFLDISYRSKVGDDEKSVEMRGGKGRAPL